MLLKSNNQSIMPTLFNELLNWNNWISPDEEQRATPKMNISEGKSDYLLEVCVPGLSKEDLNLSIDSENNLVIEMVKKSDTQEAKADDERRYLRHEFNALQFKQLLSLPENVKKEQISARVENGILRILLPKFTEEEKLAMAKHIEIQ